MMYDVYRDATAVLAWLGDENEDSAELFEILTELEGALPDLKLFKETEGGEWTIKFRQDAKSQPLQDMSSERFMATFNALCTRPYWRRVWIIQEILSSYRVILVCGCKTLPISYFARVCWEIYTNYLNKTGTAQKSLREIVSSAAFQIANHYPRQRRHRGISVEWTLQSLVQLCAQCRSACQDPRDKIYGILSLAKDTYGIAPDYGATLLALYMDVVGSVSWKVKTQIDLLLLLRPYADCSLEDYCVLLKPKTKAGGLNFPLAPVGISLKSKSVTMHPCSIIVDAASEGDAQPETYPVTGWTPKSTVLLIGSESSRACKCCTTAWDLGYTNKPKFHFSRLLSLLFLGSSGTLWASEQEVLFDDDWFTNPARPLPFSKWDNNLRQQCSAPGREIGSANWPSRIEGRRFMTLHGAVVIGPLGTKEGDILCCIDGSKRGFVIVKCNAAKGEIQSLDLVGPAIVLERKPKSEV